jgi:putative selenate reductase
LKKIKITNDNLQIVDDSPLVIKQQYQTLNIGDWCNECGNCATFCPTKGKPYVDKPKLHLNWQSFLDSPEGFYILAQTDKTTVFYRKNDDNYKLVFTDKGYIFQKNLAEIQLNKNFDIVNIHSAGTENEISLHTAVKMKIIYEAYLQIFGNTN